jgi:PAS domain S-box-containing protein
MDATSLPTLFFGVTDLALGAAFAYLWWFVLRQRYVLLIAISRLLAVPESLLLLYQVRHPALGALLPAISMVSVLGTVTAIAGLYDLVRHRLPVPPLVTLGVGLIAWRLFGAEVTSRFALQQLPEASIRGAFFLWIGWLLYRGPRRPGRRPLAVVLGIAGLHSFDYPLIAGTTWGLTLGFGLAQFNGIAISCFLLIILLDEARRLAQQTRVELQATEERLRAVVAGSPIIVFAFDREGMITLSEGQALASLGLRPGEAVGRSVFDLYGDVPAVTDMCRQALNGQIVHRVLELRGVVLESWMSPVDGPDGRVGGAIGVATDVTDLSRSQAALRQSEEKFARAFHASPNPIVLTRLSDGVVVDANEAFSRATGYSPQEALGRSTLDLIWPDPGMRAALLERLRAGERVQGRHMRMRTKAGTTMDGLVSVVVIELEGVAHLLAEATDITERVRAEEALRRTATMSALGNLVAGVAHEVRNPLFALSATLDAFDAHPEIASGAVPYTRTLRREVERLRRLMDDLLQYGRPPHLELEVADVGSVVRSAAAACRSLAEAGDVRVVTDLSDPSPQVRIDTSRMQQVFQNLIENAIHHSPRGASIAIRGAVVSGDAGSLMEVTVADQGPGIPVEDLSHVFEPFFTRRPSGTGLGLPIVQRIVEQHGGEVQLRNQSAGGALAIVRFPLGGPSTGGAAAEARPPEG